MLHFLLDESLPPSLAPLIKELGYPARHVVETGHINVDDLEILEFAEHTGEVILTHDTDFGTLLALHKKSKPSVVLFRLEQVNTEILHQLLQNNLSSITETLAEGAIIVIDAFSIRIRTLPVK